MSSRHLVALTLSFMIVAPLSAQYIPPGTTLEDGDLSEEKMIRGHAEQARWRFGALRLDPWLGLRDASLVTSSGAGGSDFTATLGAGLRGYLKTGSKWLWAGHALPEYVWWQEQSEKNTLNGRYGLGLFGYFNRLDLEISARREERQSFFSSEVQELTSLRRDTALFAFELEVSKRLALAGAYSLFDISSRDDTDRTFRRLDRETESARIGLRYRLSRHWWLGGGFEGRVNEFDADVARRLSNDDDSIFFDLGYEGQRFTGRLHLEDRSLEPRRGAVLRPFDTLTGGLETAWAVNRGIDLLAYGRRQLGYSVRDQNTVLLNDRLGARLDFDLRGVFMAVTAEVGEDDFETVVPTAPERRDDVLAFGLTLGYSLREALGFRLGVIRTEYDSNFDIFDRDVTSFTLTVDLQVIRRKLEVGDGRRIW